MATPYQRRLYEENKDLFMIIIRLGNKVVLQNQLRVLCLNLNLYKDVKEFNNVINELCDAKLFTSKYDVYNSKSNLLIVENPVLSWAYKELKEQGININKAKVKKATTDRIDKSLFKFQYAILFSKNRPYIKTLKQLLEELEKDSSILYTEKRGLEYFNSFLKNNAVLNITESESKKMIDELTMVNKRQKSSVPSRLGKGKEYTEKKAQDISVNYAKGETPSIDVINMYLSNDNKEDKATPKKVKSKDEGTIKEDVEYDNNFNSFLERGCVLRLEKTDIYQEDKHNRRMDAFFTLYIFDINESLNAIKIGEKTSRAYLMLHDLMKEGYKLRDESICLNCKKNINSPNYEQISRKSSTASPGETDPRILNLHYFRCEPGNKNNSDYNSCTDNTIKVRRDLYMDVRIASFSKDRKKDIIKECNHIKNYNPFSSKTQETELYKTFKKEGLSYDMINKIKMSARNFNIEDLYLGGKSRANITEKNRKASVRKIVKDEIKESKADIESSLSISLDNESIKKIADIITDNIMNSK